MRSYKLVVEANFAVLEQEINKAAELGYRAVSFALAQKKDESGYFCLMEIERDGEKKSEESETK